MRPSWPRSRPPAPPSAATRSRALVPALPGRAPRKRAPTWLRSWMRHPRSCKARSRSGPAALPKQAGRTSFAPCQATPNSWRRRRERKRAAAPLKVPPPPPMLLLLLQLRRRRPPAQNPQFRLQQPARATPTELPTPRAYRGCFPLQPVPGLPPQAPRSARCGQPSSGLCPKPNHWTRTVRFPEWTCRSCCSARATSWARARTRKCSRGGCSPRTAASCCQWLSPS
mmetsp:Transcript_9910/g.38563  ORF Transcript_9910/g.38563 Transcript_9910/m.38563 type:complete len:226 (+) Transcript_9910:2316-2993(+)